MGQEARLVSDVDDMIDDMPDCDEIPEGVVQYYDQVPDESVFDDEEDEGEYFETSESIESGPVDRHGK